MEAGRGKKFMTEKSKVIMSGQFEMSVPGFDKERDSILFGAYNVIVNGKEVPFDFYGMSWNIEDNGDKVTVDFESGRNFINTDNTLDEIYEETYAEQGFTISDITAEFLSQCTEIREFFVSLDIYRDGEWDELGPEEIAKEGHFQLNNLSFSDGVSTYPVKEEAIEAFNRRTEYLARLSEDDCYD